MPICFGDGFCFGDSIAAARCIGKSTVLVFMVFLIEINGSCIVFRRYIEILYTSKSAENDA